MFEAKWDAAKAADQCVGSSLGLSLQGVGVQAGGACAVAVHDLSIKGFLFHSNKPFNIGAPIQLAVPGIGSATGRVVWGSECFFGGDFCPPISEQALQAALLEGRIANVDLASQTTTQMRPEASWPASQATIPFNRPSLVGREVEFLHDAIRRGQLSGDGHYTKRCNSSIQNITQSSRALITHSCTAALEIAAILCDLAPGDEVILPSFTFVSTANAIVARGATPVFVDIDARTLNIDPVRAEAAVTPRTKAIFAVHYAGFPADMDALRRITESHGLLLVEDAAQALGSTYKGRQCGSLGDLAAFSFHETKNIISGEGGALTINRPDLSHRAEIIREKGTDRSKFIRGEVDKYTWVDVGSSYLPGELVASYLFGQLQLEPIIKKRRLAIFDRYMQALAPLASSEGVGLPHIPEHCVGNGHMFYLLMHSPEQRDEFIAHMRSNGIITPFHYVPLHSAPAGRRFGRAAGPMTETDRVSATLVRLPMFFDLGSKVEEVIACAYDFFR